MRNSTFRNNTAKIDSGGVAYVGEFSNATVEGDGNVFEENACGANGGVFASSGGSSLVINAGTFNANLCEEVSRLFDVCEGVVVPKGERERTQGYQLPLETAPVFLYRFLITGIDP